MNDRSRRVELVGAFDKRPSRPQPRLPVVMYAGTAQTGDATSITLAATAPVEFPGGWSVKLVAGAGSGQTRAISTYNGATKVVTVTPDWSPVPDVTTGYQILDL